MPKKLEKKYEENQKKLTLEEYEKKVLELANKGLTSEKIGEELKRNGIHSKEYEKKISKIHKEKYINPDLKNCEEKLTKIEEHLNKNKQDKRAKRERSRVFSQIRKIKKYLKKL
jgi:ribosomal protein S15P/S13E